MYEMFVIYTFVYQCIVTSFENCLKFASLFSKEELECLKAKLKGYVAFLA